MFEYALCRDFVWSRTTKLLCCRNMYWKNNSIQPSLRSNHSKLELTSLCTRNSCTIWCSPPGNSPLSSACRVLHRWGFSSYSTYNWRNLHSFQWNFWIRAFYRLSSYSTSCSFWVEYPAENSLAVDRFSLKVSSEVSLSFSFLSLEHALVCIKADRRR